MKTIFNILMLVFAFSSFVVGQSDWEWVNPKPQGFDLNDVAFLSATHAVAVGDEGVVIRTTNGGLNWEVSYLPVGAYNDLRGVQFRNSNLGAIVGESGSVYLTTDGGITWLPKHIGGSNYLRSLAFANDTIIVAVGNSTDSITTQMFRSTDLGDTWTRWHFSQSLDAVFFNTDSNGVAAGSGGFMVFTTDGGVTWAPQYNGYASIEDIHFSSSSKGWAVGSYSSGGFPSIDHPVVMRSLDSGKTWNSVNIGIDSVAPRGVWFISDNKGFIVAGDGRGDGTMIRTTDGGFSWSKQPVVGYRLGAITFDPGGVGMLVGGDGLIMTSNNSGGRWLNSYTNILSRQHYYDASFYDICFSDQYHAWAVARHDLARSSNQGDSWLVEPLSPNYNFETVRFGDNNNGLVMGWSPVNTDSFKTLLVVTTNGGAAWQSVTLDSSLKIQMLTDINLTENGIGYAVGYRHPNPRNHIYGIIGDFILKTTNGGLTWFFSLIDSNITFFRGISCSGQFAITRTDDALYITTNAGDSWSRQNFAGLGTQYHIRRCQALSDGVAYMTLREGYVLKSTNYGVDWAPVWLSGRDLLDLTFYDTDFGVVISGGSYIAATSDGGNSWVEQTTTPNFNLDHIAFANKNIGLAVGQGSMIIKTTTGGITDVGSGGGLPLQFFLQQNYPNPFNPVTTINYSLPQAEWVTVRIYNVLGSEVATLVDEQKYPGNYQVAWNGEGFSSGVYFYKMVTGASTLVKKMVLIK